MTTTDTLNSLHSLKWQGHYLKQHEVKTRASGKIYNASRHILNTYYLREWNKARPKITYKNVNVFLHPENTQTILLSNSKIREH